jgi:uncharacterized protein YjbI with pentapeptide repeats
MAHDKRWPPKWWQRQDQARGQHAPDLWSVWLAAPICVTVASVLAGGIYLGLLALAASRPGPNGGPPVINPLDVIKTTITVAGFVGAVLVGLYGYRKQRLVEGDARRADAEQLAQRYTTAADQLGHEKAAVRLAGVYAMARLADDWDDQRQMCIDVLCAYLRMPYETDPASEKYREGEREVRLTIIRTIRDHLQYPGVSTTWCGRDFSFTNATFDGGDFSRAKFTGDVSFHGAKFTVMQGVPFLFQRAEFAAGQVSFHEAKFTGGEVSFRGARFTGGTVIFDNAEFTGGKVSFYKAEFTGGWVYFDEAKFTEGEVNFGNAKFTGGYASFTGAEFTGGVVSLCDADFTGGEASFLDADFTGSTINFSKAKFTGGRVSFQEAKFSSSEVAFQYAEFRSGGVVFRWAKFTGGDVSFKYAEHTDGEVVFQYAQFTVACRITWGPFEPPAAWTALQERER